MTTFDQSMHNMRKDHPVRWGSRGLGLEFNLTCFVCGADRREPTSNSAMHNIAALLAKVDETPAMLCFPEGGARMAYYHGDKMVPQIKVGACTFHLPELEALSRQWFISADHIEILVKVGRGRSQLEQERLQATLDSDPPLDLQG